MKEQEFFEKMAAVWLELSKLQEQADDLVNQMSKLENAGMVNATIHTRSDNGGMELLHPTGSTYEQEFKRRREYIGKKPEAQEAARKRVGRWQKHRDLKAKWRITNGKIEDIKRQIQRLELLTLGKQAKLFSDVGTKSAGGRQPGVPTDWNWLTPQMVIEKFQQSRDLVEMADDVKAVLGKCVWAEHQQAA